MINQEAALKFLPVALEFLPVALHFISMDPQENI
jgi:hypothetical protein